MEERGVICFVLALGGEKRTGHPRGHRRAQVGG